MLESAASSFAAAVQGLAHPRPPAVVHLSYGSHLALQDRKMSKRIHINKPRQRPAIAKKMHGPPKYGGSFFAQACCSHPLARTCPCNLLLTLAAVSKGSEKPLNETSKCACRAQGKVSKQDVWGECCLVALGLVVVTSLTIWAAVRCMQQRFYNLNLSICPVNAFRLDNGVQRRCTATLSRCPETMMAGPVSSSEFEPCSAGSSPNLL